MSEIFDPSHIEQYVSNMDQTLFTFEGRLLVSSDLAWLEIGNNAPLPITDTGFVDRLLDAVPCYVGGHYLYDDNATLEGALILDAGKPAVGRIVSAKLYREDEGEYHL